MLKTSAAVLALMSGDGTGDALRAQDPDAILSFLQAEGFVARMEADSIGDPLIRVRYYDTSFEVFFYGCADNADCDAVQFYSGYRTTAPMDIATVNAWNAANRFARAYVGDDGATALEYDVFMGDAGIASADFADVVTMWTLVLTDFEDTIGW